MPVGFENCKLLSVELLPPPLLSLKAVATQNIQSEIIAVRFFLIRFYQILVFPYSLLLTNMYDKVLM